MNRSKRLLLNRPTDHLTVVNDLKSVSCSRRASSCACERIYARATSSSAPTVDTKYPRAQKCIPVCNSDADQDTSAICESRSCPSGIRSLATPHSSAGSKSACAYGRGANALPISGSHADAPTRAKLYPNTPEFAQTAPDDGISESTPHDTCTHTSRGLEIIRK